MIDVDDYQTKAMKFRLPTANATYALLNLAGELVAAVASDNGLLMSDVCRGNMDKLQSRKDRDVIKGSGNER